MLIYHLCCLLFVSVSSFVIHAGSKQASFREDICATRSCLEIKTLGTPRLILRKLTLEDAHDVFQFTCDPLVESCEPLETCIEDTQNYIKSVLEKYRTYSAAPWAIELKEEKKVIGYCGFFEWQPEHGRGRIGYAFNRHYRGQRFITEALSAVLDYAFNTLNSNRIEIHKHASCRHMSQMLTRIGMVYEGTLREFEYRCGGYQDVKVYSLLKQDYLENNHKQ